MCKGKSRCRNAAAFLRGGKKMAKRSNGEGTIFKRSDGRWCASRYVDVGNGKFKRKYVYGKTQKEVKEKLKKLESYTAPKETDTILLQEWMMEWMREYKEPILKQTTYENYMMNIQTHIVNSEIGKSELAKLTTDQLQKFYNSKLQGKGGKEKLSRRTVEYLHTIIGGALSQAYRNELLPKNVNDFTVLPRKDKQEIEPLTIEELQKVLIAAKDTRLYDLLVVEIYTGMRKGEILGLQWENVDFEKKMLYVKKNLCRVKNKDSTDKRKTKLVLMEPKTKKSVRAIPLTEEAIHILKIHRKRQNEEKMRFRDIYRDQGIVFAKPDGGFEDPREILRSFHKILEEAGVRKCRFHDLRHTFASILLNEGESMKVIQELLGHSTITTTMDIYSHVAKETKEKSVKVIERAIRVGEN